MDVHGKAGVPEGAHARLQHGRGHQPLAVVTVGVAGLAHLHQLREHGPIGKELHGLGVPDLGAAARQPGLYRLQTSIEGDGLVGWAHGAYAAGAVGEATRVEDVDHAHGGAFALQHLLQSRHFVLRVDAAEEHVTGGGDAAHVHQRRRTPQALVVPSRAQQVGHQAHDDGLVAGLEEVATCPVDLRVAGHIGLREPELVGRPGVHEGLVERTLPQDDRAVGEEFVQHLPVVPAVQRRLVAPSDEPVVVVCLGRRALQQQAAVVLGRAGGRAHAAVRLLPGLGRDVLHGHEQRAQERVDVVVDQAGQQHLVGEPVVHRHLAALAPHRHVVQVPHRDDTALRNCHRRGLRQRLVHRVDAPSREDGQRRARMGGSDGGVVRHGGALLRGLFLRGPGMAA